MHIFMVLFIISLLSTKFLYHSLVSYHPDEELFMWGKVFILWSCLFPLYKNLFVQQFYITETGLRLRKGFSGKWYQIDFDKIAAITVNLEKSGRYRIDILIIVCQNHILFPIMHYTNSSIAKAVELLEKKNIPVYQNIVDAKQSAINYTPGTIQEFEQPGGKPLHRYLHYCAAVLPLFAAIFLFSSGFINEHCGTQVDKVFYGTITRIDSSGGKTWLEINKFPSSVGANVQQREGNTDNNAVLMHDESFPVRSDVSLQLHTDDQVEVHYTRGCLGLDYGITYKKL